MTPTEPPKVKVTLDNGDVIDIPLSQVRLTDRRHFDVSECIGEMTKDTVIVDADSKMVIVHHTAAVRKRLIVPQAGNMLPMILEVSKSRFNKALRDVAKNNPTCVECGVSIPPGRPGRKCAHCRKENNG